jgi:hypothetical protein
MIKKLHEMGMRSEQAYWAGAASIGLAILAWATSLRTESAGLARADRWGIFVGEWAPTFFALGNGLRSYEAQAEAAPTMAEAGTRRTTEPVP